MAMIERFTRYMIYLTFSVPKTYTGGTDLLYTFMPILSPTARNASTLLPAESSQFSVVSAT